jgi:hypothetical protein
MGLRQWPDTASGTADYYISPEIPEVGDGLRVAVSLDNVTNYIIEQHQGTVGNVYTTPTEDSRLANAGTATYGRLEVRGPLAVNTLGSAIARGYSLSYIARNGSTMWKASSGLTVTGFIRGAGGRRVPASEIRAGQVVRFDNFMESWISTVNTPFVITSTDYDDNSQVCTLSVGLPDSLPMWLARQLRNEGKTT